VQSFFAHESELFLSKRYKGFTYDNWFSICYKSNPLFSKKSISMVTNKYGILVDQTITIIIYIVIWQRKGKQTFKISDCNYSGSCGWSNSAIITKLNLYQILRFTLYNYVLQRFMALAVEIIL